MLRKIVTAYYIDFLIPLTTTTSNILGIDNIATTINAFKFTKDDLTHHASLATSVHELGLPISELKIYPR